MRYTLLCLITLFVSYQAKCQNETDSLSKYSYNILGINFVNGKTETILGSCFFFRKNRNIYLVTAKHVVSGCDTGYGKHTHFPDDLAVNLHGNAILPLHIKEYKDTVNCKSADFEIFKIKTDSIHEKYIYSVESLIDDIPNKRLSAVMIGYPGTMYKNDSLTGNGIIPFTAKKLLINKGDYKIFYLTPDYKQTFDSSEIMIECSLSVDTENRLNGFSGSPFFVQDKKSKRWIAVGIFSGSSHNKNNSYLYYYRIIDAIKRKIQ